jgi:hypothetical protein
VYLLSWWFNSFPYMTSCSSVDTDISDGFLSACSGSKQSKKPNRHEVISRKTLIFIKLCKSNLAFVFLSEHCRYIFSGSRKGSLSLWARSRQKVETLMSQTYDGGVAVIHPYGCSPPPHTHTNIRYVCKYVNWRRHYIGAPSMFGNSTLYGSCIITL